MLNPNNRYAIICMGDYNFNFGRCYTLYHLNATKYYTKACEYYKNVTEIDAKNQFWDSNNSNIWRKLRDARHALGNGTAANEANDKRNKILISGEQFILNDEE
jgi:hypothetical protein